MASFIAAATYINPSVFPQTEKAPVPKHYVLDAFVFLRVHDLMQQDKGFYPAFFQAYVDREHETGTPNTFLHWRPPLIYWIWNFVPGGAHGVLYVYWALACLALLAAYGAARSRLPDGIALWAPLLLYPYYFYGAVTLWFSYQDWWASFFMFYGLYFQSRKSPYLTAFFWSLAATTREHFGYLMVILAVKAIRGSRQDRIGAAVALLSVGTFYAVHYWTVRPFISPESTVLGGWREAGPGFIWSCLRFGSVYFSQRHITLIPMLLLGAIGAIRVCRRSDGWSWAVAILVPISVYLFIGAAGATTGGL
jgi:hypothetical protein